MKSVKMPTNDSYREFLIERLKNSEHAAGFLEAILEEEEPEPELLRNALRKVVEAYERMNKLSELANQKHQQLDRLLTQSGCTEIYAFVELLDVLGFRVVISEKY